MIVCPNCGTANPERARFCLECATSLADVQPTLRRSGVRKLVTVLFADAVGSTALGERIDPETMRGALGRSFSVAKEVLERHGGTVEKFIGDAVMAVFGIPVLHEDDALRAVRAALELRDRLAAIDREIEAERGIRVRFRIGVNSGEVVTGGGDESTSTLVTGDAVNTAARLEQAAQPGEILIGALTYRLVQDHATAEAVEPIEAKGKSEPTPAFRLLSVEGAEEAAAPRRLSARMVGRQRELARLEEAFEDASAQRRCQLFTLLGAAGVGKSRLVAEFLGRVGERAMVVRGRCLPYGEGITYWPIAEIVRAAARFEESDDAEEARRRIDRLLLGLPEAERVAALLANMMGLSEDTTPREEVLWAVRRLLEHLASDRAVVCVIDDIHWAEPTLLDLIEYVADWSRDAAILLVCPARPELLEDRPTWAGGKLNATTILLEPLDEELSRELVLDLLGTTGLPGSVPARILETAEGNPLFAEEIVRMLVDDGLIRAANGGWIVDERLHSMPMPASVQGVIAARLDRLPPSERTVAERAAVVGRLFERDAVAELLPDDLRDELPARLMALVRKELLRPARSDLTLEEAYRFRHLLIRDTAYEAIPKEERAELHERFAAWLEGVAGERVAEYGEIVGYHYEQAHRYRSEVGLHDARTEHLAERAGNYLTEAGRRAYLLGDAPAAAKLQARGLPLLPVGVERQEVLLMLAIAAQSVGRWKEAHDAVASLLDEGAVVDDPVPLMKARLLEQLIGMWTDPSWESTELLDLLRQATTLFEAAGDQHGLAIAYRTEANIHIGAERWEACHRACERALRHASAIGDRSLEEASRQLIVGASLWGPTPLREVLRVAEEQRAAVHSRLAVAQIFGFTGMANALLGEADVARAHIRECRRIRTEVLGEASAYVFVAGLVEYILGDLDTAEIELQRTAHTLERLGETGLRATTVGRLARVQFDIGRPDEQVLANVELTARLAARGDAEAQSSWRMTKALLEARAGRFVEAEPLATEALEIRADTDVIRGIADLQVARAWVRERAGRLDHARRDLEQALALYQQKGALIGIARVEARLAALGAPAEP